MRIEHNKLNLNNNTIQQNEHKTSYHSIFWLVVYCLISIAIKQTSNKKERKPKTNTSVRYLLSDKKN